MHFSLIFLRTTGPYSELFETFATMSETNFSFGLCFRAVTQFLHKTDTLAARDTNLCTAAESLFPKFATFCRAFGKIHSPPPLTKKRKHFHFIIAANILPLGRRRIVI